MPTFLHVGCGPLRKADTTPGFGAADWNEVRLDIDPDVKPDIVASTTDMSPVPDASMDGLYSSHNIEHLYPTEVPTALREFARVLKPDGFAVITCPDLQSVAAVVAQGKLLEPLYESSMGPISAIDILFGHRASLAKGNLFMAHRTGFTAQVLWQLLSENGFPSVIVRHRPSHFDLWAAASRAVVPDDRLRELARMHFPTPPSAKP
ncbi:MAG: class I SAM-dependent methyltransferase [Phenylobacterium sp.]|uniref:class I SAM-dependent methyltransferase n=1 Tax=Phenylobacterium sp. TaxID=1871053 RepID=UPI00120829F4|nr:methyltransferase domain-containing protein [Phenylobacterium sp.]TAJ71679.1 MAG: class I SAM-dependent methyltransferase [Phenylobacterium sp.]